MQNEFDYRKYLNLLLKHKRLFAITALIIMTGTAVVSYLLPKKYEARSSIFVERNVLNELFKGMAVTPSVDESLRRLNSAINSRTLLTKVANDLDLNLKNQSDAQLDATINGLRNRTNLQFDDKEGLIKFSFIDENPRFARDYVNTLVRRYIEENLSSKREESYGATSFISDQIASVKQKLDKAEAEITKFRAEKVAVLASEPASLLPEISASQQRLDDLSLRRSQLEAERNRLKTNDPAKDRVAALQRRLEELRVEYTDNYPEVIKVKADIEAAKKEIGRGLKGSGAAVPNSQELDRVEAELNAVRMSESSQRAQLAASRGLMRENPGTKAAMDKLEQERGNYKTMYDQLMARHGQAEFSNQMEVQDKAATIRIMEPAIMPRVPVSPNRFRIILIGIAAGIAAGFGVLLAIDYFDKSVKTVDTLKTLGINVLAVIPKISDPKAIEIERRNDLRLYIASGTYFTMIVALLALEFLGMSPVDSIIGMISG
jgi:succinoglycan biosynthesis transport protein ExoP